MYVNDIFDKAESCKIPVGQQQQQEDQQGAASSHDIPVLIGEYLTGFARCSSCESNRRLSVYCLVMGGHVD